MKKQRNLLIVGGTGRNVGKTELVCSFIRKFGRIYKIIALKVSTISPDLEENHGSHQGEDKNFIIEELVPKMGKDTQRMLEAGADRVFYMRTNENSAAELFNEFLKKVGSESLIICESNFLRDYVNPGLYAVVTDNGNEMKPSAKKRIQQADLVIVSNKTDSFTHFNEVSYSERNGWFIEKDTNL